MLAPISWRTPPRAYGPWELVTSLLTEALVARGVDVTLFATRDSITAGKLAGAGGVVLLYVVLGLVALAVDRRALMVSALAYVLYALSALFREFGAPSRAPARSARR